MYPINERFDNHFGCANSQRNNKFSCKNVRNNNRGYGATAPITVGFNKTSKSRIAVI